MTSDPINALESDPARRTPPAPEAELPQAPPGVPEGHDGGPAPAYPTPRVKPAPEGEPGPEGEHEARAEPESKPGPEGEHEARAEPEAEIDVPALTARAQKADEYLDLAQRTKAEFENYRKRASREAAAAQERGAIKLAIALLPAIDNLDRALAHADSAATDADAAPDGNGTASLVAGIKHVHTDVIAALGRAGIEPYSPDGQAFDPVYHEAVAQQPVDGAQPGTVVEVFQRGYRLGESVLRPARVVVAG